MNGKQTGTHPRAAHQIWSDTPLHYVGLDSSRAMQVISAALLAQIPSQNLFLKLHQTSLGAPDLSAILSTSFPQIPKSETLALIAYTLGDLPSDKIRRETISEMWASGAEVIAVIDRGTPRGFNIVATARDQLLRLGRHANGGTFSSKISAEEPLLDENEEDDDDELVFGSEKFVAEKPAQLDSSIASGSTPLAESNRGCYIVAPVFAPNLLTSPFTEI